MKVVVVDSAKAMSATALSQIRQDLQRGRTSNLDVLPGLMYN